MVLSGETVYSLLSAKTSRSKTFKNSGSTQFGLTGNAARLVNSLDGSKSSDSSGQATR